MTSPPLDFEMTPELKEIAERDAGRILHPSMPSSTQIDHLIPVYNPSMNSPHPMTNEES